MPLRPQLEPALAQRHPDATLEAARVAAHAHARPAAATAQRRAERLDGLRERRATILGVEGGGGRL